MRPAEQKKNGSVATPVDAAAETHPYDVAASTPYIASTPFLGCLQS